MTVTDGGCYTASATATPFKVMHASVERCEAPRVQLGFPLRSDLRLACAASRPTSQRSGRRHLLQVDLALGYGAH